MSHLNYFDICASSQIAYYFTAHGNYMPALYVCRTHIIVICASLLVLFYGYISF